MTLNQTDLTHAQGILLMMLKDFDAFCAQQGLTYFLSDGTLLGAIRHGGFIPWDDDADVCMLRDDYERLIAMRDRLPKKYAIQSEETDGGYGQSWAKLVLLGTVWKEDVAQNTARNFSGLFVDIFPVDAIPDGGGCQSVLSFRYDFLTYLISLKCRYKFDCAGNVPKRMVLGALSLVARPFSVAWLCKRRRKMCVKYNGRALGQCTRYYIHDFFRNKSGRDAYAAAVPHQFEDATLKIPQGWKELLETEYGDYMALPPQEERVSHGVVEFDFGGY